MERIVAVLKQQCCAVRTIVISNINRIHSLTCSIPIKSQNIYIKSHVIRHLVESFCIDSIVSFVMWYPNQFFAGSQPIFCWIPSISWRIFKKRFLKGGSIFKTICLHQGPCKIRVLFKITKDLCGLSICSWMKYTPGVRVALISQFCQCNQLHISGNISQSNLADICNESEL